MKAFLIVVTMAAVAVAGVLVLRNSTQYTNAGNHGATTTVVFGVEQKDSHGSKFAADTLWNFCVHPLAWKTTDTPVKVGANWRASLHPGLSSDAERRLKGCLNDVVVNRMTGDVRSVKTD